MCGANNLGDNETNYRFNSGSNIGLYIPINYFYNINDIQAIAMFSRNDGLDLTGSFVGQAIESYNRNMDPNLVSLIILTPIIDKASIIYRFDFPFLPMHSSFV